jgi:hypothetical protein
MTNDPVALRALKNPAKWMLCCPECGEGFTLQSMLDADPNRQLSAIDLRSCVCHRHPLTLMVLRPIKFNIKDVLFMFAIYFRLLKA